MICGTTKLGEDSLHVGLVLGKSGLDISTTTAMIRHEATVRRLGAVVGLGRIALEPLDRLSDALFIRHRWTGADLLVRVS